MPLTLDHLVIHVSDLPQAVADYQTLGFTVQAGGSHADGHTHNALVGFADGSYLELIAFLEPAPQHRWHRHQQSGREGLIDFALSPERVDQLIARVRPLGLAYQGPVDGGRLRPDGQRLQWQIGSPPSPDLPFLCGDISPRSLRVPEGRVRQHANGIQGVASITLRVRDLQASLWRYQTLLEVQPTQAPLALSGLGLAQAVLPLGPTGLVLLSPLKDADTAAARTLRQELDSLGEGLLGASLRAPADTPPAWQAWPLARSHGVHFDL
ncbi:MAG: VOC family protein [Curvibacter sp.]|nr:VOC family protein [Curvibacter sp.]